MVHDFLETFTNFEAGKPAKMIWKFCKFSCILETMSALTKAGESKRRKPSLLIKTTINSYTLSKIHSNIIKANCYKGKLLWRQTVIKANCYTGKMLYCRRKCSRWMRTWQMSTWRMSTWRISTRRMSTRRMSTRRMSTRLMSTRRKCTRQNVT